MRLRTARVAVYSVVALLAYAAVQGTAPPRRHPAALLLTPVRAPAWTQQLDTLKRGETLIALLERRGLRGSRAAAALAAAEAIDERRVPAGMAVSVRSHPSDTVPSEIVFTLAPDRLVKVQRNGNLWTGSEERLPWTTDTMVVSGVIHSTLYEALDEGSGAALPRQARSELAWNLADILEYRVDMSRDLQDGDSFRVLVVRSTGPGGLVRMGTVLAASMHLSGTEIQAIRYRSTGVAGDYFDQNGKSLRAAFLRAPLEFRRISSVFGMRKHPILGIWKQHKGTDYAAAQGTPVRALGDGVVVRAGWYRGYGNTVEIRHRNGYVTRYGHLRNFAAGTRVGARVTIGKTVAYVGTTGLSTAPHLHFEMLIGGQQRDSRSVLRRLQGGDPVPGSERSAFQATRNVLLASLDQPDGSVRVAAR